MLLPAVEAGVACFFVAGTDDDGPRWGVDFWAEDLHPAVDSKLPLESAPWLDYK